MRPLLAAFVSTLVAAAAAAAEIPLPRPGDREFVVDKAEMISPEDEARIKESNDRLLTETATPVVVVTIESMAKYGGADATVEGFARALFDQWGVGHATVDDQPHDRGILLLVARDDRAARIELGTGWGLGYDRNANWVMERRVIPLFRQGRFSEGIVSGVEGLEAMVRGRDLTPARTDGLPGPSGAVPRDAPPAEPPAPSPESFPDSTGHQRRGWDGLSWVLPFVGVAVAFILRLFGGGRGGGFPGFDSFGGGGYFGGHRGGFGRSFGSGSRTSSSGGGGGGRSGGFSGGSFGGGRSGGGGATGRW